jgi:hypothetical protein
VTPDFGNLFRHLQLLPDDLHQHPLAAAAVEFTVEDLLPRAKVELPFGDGDDDFPAHDLPFQVGIGVVLPRPVVMVVLDRFMGSQLFEPNLKIVMKTAFVVVYKYRRRDVHRIYETNAFLNATFPQEFFDGVRDVYEPSTIGHLEPEMFGQ